MAAAVEPMRAAAVADGKTATAGSAVFGGSQTIHVHGIIGFMSRTNLHFVDTYKEQQTASGEQTNLGRLAEAVFGPAGPRKG